MAFGRSSGPTISTMKACRSGMSKALTAPRHPAMTTTAATVTSRVATSVPSASASSIASAGTTTASRCRPTRPAPTPPARAGPGTARRIERERDEPVSEGRRVPNGDENATHAVVDGLIGTDRRGRDDGASRRHRLERRLRHRLAARALHDDVHRGEQVRYVVALSEKRDGTVECGISRQGGDPGRIAPAADHKEPGARHARAHEPCGGEQVVEALLPREPADGTGGDIPRPDAERAPHRR